MATAGDVAQLALKKILVQAGDAPLEPDEYADLFEEMNHFMQALESEGVRLGWTDVDNVADLITLPKGAIRGLIANVAMEVAPSYLAPVTPQLQAQARAGMKVMRKLGQTIIQTSYDDNLPMGTGNADYEGGRNFTLYQPQIMGILSLVNNSLTTEISAADTAVPVYGFWNVEATKSLRGSTDGEMENVTGDNIDVDVDLSITATGNSTYTFRLMKSGVSQATVSSALTSTPATVTISKALTLGPSDFLSVQVEDDLATEDLVVTQALMEVS